MFKVIGAHGDEGAEWDRLIQTLPYDLRDIHFTAGWGRSQERGGALAKLAVWINDWFMIVQPFLLRPVPQKHGYWDMTAAGYGGRACNANLLAPGDGDEFDAELDRWAAERNVISEFYMLNPVTAVSQLPLIDRKIPLHYERMVSILPLGMDLPMHKNRVQSLAKAAGRVEITDSFDLQQFARNYGLAMAAKGASERWQLSMNDFVALDVNLGRNVLMLNAWDDKQVRAQAIFLIGTGATAYYYLAARSVEPADGFADRLIVEAAGRARLLGCAYLHLGGGLHDDDTLDAYKASFGGLRRPVYSVRRVLLPSIYAGLSAGHKPEFFPQYRAEEIAQ